MGSSAQALKFEKNGHLASATARGPKSARLIVDRDALLMHTLSSAADKLVADFYFDWCAVARSDCRRGQGRPVVGCRRH